MFSVLDEMESVKLMTSAVGYRDSMRLVTAKLKLYHFYVEKLHVKFKDKDPEVFLRFDVLMDVVVVVIFEYLIKE
jgi:hypothetical protein